MPETVDPLLHADKIRGALLGLAVGEALGTPVDGQSRDAILRRHGRVTHLLAGAAVGPLTSAALEVVRHLASTVLEPAGGHMAVAGWGWPIRLVTAPLATVLDAGVRVPADRSFFPSDDGITTEVIATLAALLRLALASDPYRALSASSALRCVTQGLASWPEVAPALAAHARIPPSPDVALLPFLNLPDPVAAIASAIDSILCRPRSIEDAVVYAVNLGGNCATRAAVTGMLAGAHRGGASVPERWLPTTEWRAEIHAVARGISGAQPLRRS